MTEQTYPTRECPHCQNIIPAEATFCWYCTRELVARPERPEPAPKPTNWKLILIVASGVLLAIVLCLIFNPLN